MQLSANPVASFINQPPMWLLSLYSLSLVITITKKGCSSKTYFLNGEMVQVIPRAKNMKIDF